MRLFRSGPEEPGRNLILGVIENYSFADVEPFLCSLRQTGYTGEIVLFYSRVPPAAIEAIRDFHVTLIPFRTVRGALEPRMQRRFFDRLSKLYHRVKWPLHARYHHRLLSAARLRYILFHGYLSAHGDRFSRVLLSDVRDVFFQADPFSNAGTEDLVFFEESHCLGYGDYNANWIRLQLGQATLDRLAPRMTLCSGTTMGSPAALCWYLGRFLALMQKADRQDLRMGDQGIHNAVAYEGLEGIPYSLRYSRNGCEEVYTLTQYLATAEIRRGPTGAVVNPSGKPVPIVHQYDRHPEIQQSLLESLSHRASGSDVRGLARPALN